ncbi:MAG: NADH:flavin oxidoreductase [Peptococcaceae bacterium]|nr:NADH:flavin oxidoreductase [Peptococcaceae bacterium]
MANLLKPLQAGALELTNRLVMPPMASAKAEPDGSVSQALLDYYAEKSAGGDLGLVIIEHSFIAPEGKASNQQLSVATDSQVDGLRRLADTLHRNGVKAAMQINHAGSAADAAIIGTTPVAPSAVINPRKGNLPRELSVPEIADIIDAFQKAALRTKQAGFDAVEIHSAHGYLLNQFLSPLANQRSDEYGGSIQQRIRLHLEVIAAVRAAVGEDFPVLIRLGASDFMPGGTTIEDSIIAAQEFAKVGVSILDISGGFCGYMVPELKGQGYFAPLTHAIKQVVSIPVILTGGITEPQAAEQLLAEGKADLIGVGRALLQDSGWTARAVQSLQ